MAFDREQVLSEFIDAWNAGARPDVDDYLARVPEPERVDLADELVSFLAFAPTPEYDDADLEAIRAEPIVVAATEAAAASGSLLPSLLGQVRDRLSMSTAEVARDLVPMLGLPKGGEEKTASYLDRLERGELEPWRVSGRLFEGLARVFGMPRNEIQGAADFRAWTSPPAPAPAPVFRADEESAALVADHLEALADAIEAPSRTTRDEIDDLFLGGR